jgi:isoleucyl-tRNA synthetase
MEKARNDKMFGSSLQAHPAVYLDTESKKLLDGIDFAEISISSSITLSGAAVPSGAFTLADVPGIGVEVKLADGEKCDRCWQVLKEVGSKPDHPTLCLRCHDVVSDLSKAAA